MELMPRIVKEEGMGIFEYQRRYLAKWDASSPSSIVPSSIEENEQEKSKTNKPLLQQCLGMCRRCATQSDTRSYHASQFLLVADKRIESTHKTMLELTGKEALYEEAFSQTYRTIQQLAMVMSNSF
eukprot:TRINITY_DN7088_c0_g1_i1.p1 TRINITY_DN7088_c0_g1~~TRINITY_DN7088_c0_g1_i1.p1  ORF type:complete len:126 (-),score=14.18 TRINITY_DN7088_c0_g1_i1:234-611(-)